jgi:hypothetical protein
VIVGVDDERKSSQPSWVVRVGALIGPLLQEGLDESLGLAVGLRTVVARASVRGSDGIQGLVERPRSDVALGVAGHYPLDGDPVLRQMGCRAKDEPSRGLTSLIGQHPDVGVAGTIVHGDVDVVVSDPPAPPGPIAVDPVSSSGSDPPEFLHVQVHQLPGPLTLVAADRHPGGSIEPVQTRQAAAAKHRVDRGARVAELRAEAVRAVLVRATSHGSSGPGGIRQATPIRYTVSFAAMIALLSETAGVSHRCDSDSRKTEHR